MMIMMVMKIKVSNMVKEIVITMKTVLIMIIITIIIILIIAIVLMIIINRIQALCLLATLSSKELSMPIHLYKIISNYYNQN